MFYMVMVLVVMLFKVYKLEEIINFKNLIYI